MNRAVGYNPPPVSQTKSYEEREREREAIEEAEREAELVARKKAEKEEKDRRRRLARKCLSPNFKDLRPRAKASGDKEWYEHEISIFNVLQKTARHKRYCLSKWFGTNTAILDDACELASSFEVECDNDRVQMTPQVALRHRGIVDRVLMYPILEVPVAKTSDSEGKPPATVRVAMVLPGHNGLGERLSQEKWLDLDLHGKLYRFEVPKSSNIPSKIYYGGYFEYSEEYNLDTHVLMEETYSQRGFKVKGQVTYIGIRPDYKTSELFKPAILLNKHRKTPETYMESDDFSEFEPSETVQSNKKS